MPIPLGIAPSDDSVRSQYNKLAEDWRQLNSMLWAIPSAAVSIMAGVVVVAYQDWLGGLPRLLLLTIGSLFLFALTLEVLKKGVYLTVITRRLDAVQELLLGDEEKVDKNKKIAFNSEPVKVVEEYLCESKNEIKKKTFKGRLYYFPKYGRTILACVMFVAAVGVGFLALMETTILNHVKPELNKLVFGNSSLGVLSLPLALSLHRI